MENEQEENDSRSDASARQPQGDVIGDDLPPALIEVTLRHAFPRLQHRTLPPPLQDPTTRAPGWVRLCLRLHLLVPWTAACASRIQFYFSPDIIGNFGTQF